MENLYIENFKQEIKNAVSAIYEVEKLENLKKLRSFYLEKNDLYKINTLTKAIAHIKKWGRLNVKNFFK